MGKLKDYDRFDMKKRRTNFIFASELSPQTLQKLMTDVTIPFLLLFSAIKWELRWEFASIFSSPVGEIFTSFEFSDSLPLA